MGIRIRLRCEKAFSGESMPFESRHHERRKIIPACIDIRPGSYHPIQCDGIPDGCRCENVGCLNGPPSEDTGRT